MKLQFDMTQQYQRRRIAVADLFDGQPQGAEYSVIQVGEWGGLFAGQARTELGVGNQLMLAPDKLLANTRMVQARNDIEIGDTAAPLSPANCSTWPPTLLRLALISPSKWRRGPGKTYVYLRTIFELSAATAQKFIIVVPSVAIREVC